jgi:deoxyinosine 3'endonuclease (endonuclease V)
VPEVKKLHSWDLTTSQARDLQLELAARVDATRPLRKYSTVAGADVSCDLRGKWLYAAVSRMRSPWSCRQHRSIGNRIRPALPTTLSTNSDGKRIIEARDPQRV